MAHKKPTLAFVVDDRVSREKRHLLMRVLTSLRHHMQVEVLGVGLSEEEVLAKLGARDYQVVLVPWYRYTAWTRIEALYGRTRTTGPAFAGYFCDQVLPYELGDVCEHLRAILLDFGGMRPGEVVNLIRALADDKKRSGLRPLLQETTRIYRETWHGGQGLGSKLDAVMSLPEITGTEWASRSASVRICLQALWSLVYEEGPGKNEFGQSKAATRGWFQVAADSGCLVLRLCYTLPNWSPKDAVTVFWPSPRKPTSSAQLLLRYADVLRVHTFTDPQEIEVVATFLPSAAAELTTPQLHSLWIEPLDSRVVTEHARQQPDSNHPWLVPLPGGSGASVKSTGGEPTKNSDRALYSAAQIIKELKTTLREKERAITELRSGGVGTAPPLPPPDAEGLLEAFQEKYQEARFQIRQFELQIQQAEKNGAAPQAIEGLRRKMVGLIEREQEWIRKLGTTIEGLRRKERAG